MFLRKIIFIICWSHFQAMIKLMEPVVELMCIKQDVPLIETLLKDC